MLIDSLQNKGTCSSFHLLMPDYLKECLERIFSYSYVYVCVCVSNIRKNIHMRTGESTLSTSENINIIHPRSLTLFQLQEKGR